MFDIVEIFPTAKEMSKMNNEDFSLFFFEIDLRNVFQMIAAGASAGVKKVDYVHPNKKVIEFLKDKGYIIHENENKVIIEW